MNHPLTYLLNNYLAGKLSAEERSHLLELLESDSGTEAFANVIQQQLSQSEYLIEEDLTETQERMIQLIRKKITTHPAGIIIPPTRRMIFVSTRWWRYAAAVIVFLGIGAYLYYFYPQTPLVPATSELHSMTNDLPPGSHKATLTLADGSTIELDSMGNRVLARQGGTVVEQSGDGQIVYRPDENGNKNTRTLSAGYNTMGTPRGGQYQIALPDGTRVWLNAASSITYPTAFTGKERSVSVTGEVYFEVAKNKDQPFRVQAGNVQVDVLGTHFNVNAYADEYYVTTTLLEGSVRIIDQVLIPGKQAQVKNNLVKVVDADTDLAIAWKNGFFHFKRTDIQSVMRQVARWYDVEIVYEGKVPRDSVSGELPLNASLVQVLRALGKIQVHFRIEGKKIIVTP